MSSILVKPNAANQGAPGAGMGMSVVSYSASLNNFPTVSFNVSPGKEGSTSAPPIATAMRLAGQAQANAGSGTVNINLSMDDGQGGKATFKGMHTGPSFDLATRVVGLTFGGVHEAAAVCTLNLSIYTPLDWRKLFQKVPLEVKGTVPARMLALLDIIIADWQEYIAVAPDSPAKKVANALHEANTEPLRIFRAILSASDEAKIENLDEALSDLANLNFQFNVHLATRLLTRASNFWSVIQAICASFGFVYIPPAMKAVGAYGKLSAYEAIWNKPSSLTIPTTGLRMSLGNIVIAPISHVTMFKGLNDANYKLEGNPLDGRGMFNEGQEALVRFPEEPKGGRPMVIPLPDFIAAQQAKPWITPEGFKESASYDNAREVKKTLAQAFGSHYEAMTKICRAICKQTFLDVSLADATASISIPLNLNAVCGMMYDVTAQGGGVLFRGLLRSVSHALASEDTTASTSLAFSHVQAGEYRLL